MRPWIKRTLFGLFGATVALGGLTACGHRHGHERLSSMSVEDQAQLRQKVVDRVARRLDLDPEQKQRLDTLAVRLNEQRLALRGAGDPRAEVRSLVASERFDRQKAQAMLGQKMAAVQAGSPEVIAAFGDFFDSLNPSQQAQVRDFLQHRHHGWWRRG
ncbi:Spy/CpxP family protein refolding chaperone [Ramlibacter pallidus]|uniref:Spy/CpxP family protein refolding chaperone n=1 Tax=Ramlibacter pallidus TaxID=2780087 RepID=A0ABR9S3T3_9BURK|nr:Spy/CpxP family protein refolding chaperone [Ramlibacter pallidus]MBE7368165.1 Spy/CpxP family protein refolding chaperone [Ramlibacter pallidus]